jgi:hypothetical protein
MAGQETNGNLALIMISAFMASLHRLRIDVSIFLATTADLCINNNIV